MRGLQRRIVLSYNTILHLSGIVAVSGLAENGRAGMRGVLVPVVFVPMLPRIQPNEFRRLKVPGASVPWLVEPTIADRVGVVELDASP